MEAIHRFGRRDNDFRHRIHRPALGRRCGLLLMTRQHPADTLEEREAMERRHDGPWTQRDLDRYRLEQKRAKAREHLWEWHRGCSEQEEGSSQ